jgi:serine/threonine-protein kinase
LPAISTRLIARLCDGLHAVHQTRDERGQLLNLVHCDITPHNLFVLYDGTVRLMDFGVARANKGMMHQSPQGSAHGKVPYMAPEQLEGHEPDCRSDVWAMGVVLWEMLSGTPLFDGRSLSNIALEVMEKRIAAPSEVNPRVPNELSQIVCRALARNPAERVQSARHLGNELESFLGDKGDSVPAAHVASWLDRLFPGRGVDRRGLRAMAHAIGDQLIPPSVRPLGDLGNSLPANQPTAQPAERTWDGANATIELSFMPGLSTLPGEPGAAGPKSARRRKPLYLGLAVAALLVGVFLGVRALRPGKEVAAAAVPLTAAPTANPAHAPARESTPAPLAVTPERSAASALEVPTPNVVPAVAPNPPATSVDLTPQPVAPTAAAPAAATKVARKPRAAEPTPFAAPAFVGEGSVYVLSSPGAAEIVFQGRVLGTTPLRIKLPAGHQRLILRPTTGGSPVGVDVHVEEGGNSFATIKLVP